MVICLLQDLEQQSNFGDTLGCVDRVEQSTGTVSFAMYMCVLYWHYCMRHVVAQQELCLYAHWWRCTKIFTILSHTCAYYTHAHACMCARSYNYVTMIMMCMYHCMCCLGWRFSYGNTLFTVLCGMPGMSLYSEISCWSRCTFNCMCAVAPNSC